MLNCAGSRGTLLASCVRAKDAANGTLWKFSAETFGNIREKRSDNEAQPRVVWWENEADGEGEGREKDVREVFREEEEAQMR